MNSTHWLCGPNFLLMAMASARRHKIVPTITIVVYSSIQCYVALLASLTCRSFQGACVLDTILPYDLHTRSTVQRMGSREVRDQLSFSVYIQNILREKFIFWSWLLKSCTRTFIHKPKDWCSCDDFLVVPWCFGDAYHKMIFHITRILIG